MAEKRKEKAEKIPPCPTDTGKDLNAMQKSSLDLPKVFVSAAECVWKYQHLTPQRFRKYPRNTAPAVESENINWNLKLTVPMSPKLHTEERILKRKRRALAKARTEATVPEKKMKKIITKKLSPNKNFILKNILATKTSKCQKPTPVLRVKTPVSAKPKISLQVMQARKIKLRAISWQIRNSFAAVRSFRCTYPHEEEEQNVSSVGMDSCEDNTTDTSIKGNEDSSIEVVASEDSEDINEK